MENTDDTNNLMLQISDRRDIKTDGDGLVLRVVNIEILLGISDEILAGS